VTRPAAGVLHAAAFPVLDQLLHRLRLALLTPLLPPLKLHFLQLTIHVLQLPPLRYKLVAAVRALRLTAGHRRETLRADLHAWRCLAVLLRRPLQRPLTILQVVA
jgi:hypothetical protein